LILRATISGAGKPGHMEARQGQAARWGRGETGEEERQGKRRDRGRGETGEEERQGKRRDRGRGETGEEERQGQALSLQVVGRNVETGLAPVCLAVGPWRSAPVCLAVGPWRSAPVFPLPVGPCFLSGLPVPLFSTFTPVFQPLYSILPLSVWRLAPGGLPLSGWRPAPSPDRDR